ncbi:unnamed protein product [Pieris brassicae]|uniref:Uncharacterized protein n=1 Tax=Pieris brassicae TaxID=7116 RepID=A0A9P0TL98_PIEBR|nr:unnamed protein product [Pieris brassicae]
MEAAEGEERGLLVDVGRQRRRRDGPDVTEGLRSIYNDRKRALRGAICEAKERAHQDVLRGLDDDPWRRPYRSARKRLKGAGMPLVESLEPAFLDRVVADLFPLPPDIVPPCMAATVRTDDGRRRG